MYSMNCKHDSGKELLLNKTSGSQLFAQLVNRNPGIISTGITIGYYLIGFRRNIPFITQAPGERNRSYECLGQTFWYLIPASMVLILGPG